MVFFGFKLFKWLFEPVRIDLDRVSAQTVDSGPKSCYLCKLGYWGGGPLAESLRCRQESRQKSRGAVKKNSFWCMSAFCPKRKNAAFF